MTEQPLKDRRYTIWIEAECWAPEDWNYADGNTDVLVRFSDSEAWSATLVTYANLRTLTAKNQRTGECLSGTYFWASELVLVDSISRPSIKALVRGLLDADEFNTVFVRCVEPGESGLDWSQEDPIFARFVERARREGSIRDDISLE